MKRMHSVPAMLGLGALGAAFLYAGCSEGPVPIGQTAWDAAPDTMAGDSPLDVPTGDSPLDTAGDSTVLDCLTLSGKLARWAQMDSDPIVPNGSFAGLPYRGLDMPITIEQAEAINCKGIPVATDDAGNTVYLVDAGPDVFTGQVAWGTGYEMQLTYDPSTHQGIELTGTAPYAGSMSFSYMGHSYVMGMGVLSKDGSPFVIDWTNLAAADLAVTELSNAVNFNFAPGQPSQSNCRMTGVCLLVLDIGTGTGWVGFRPSHVFFLFAMHSQAPTTALTAWAWRPDGGLDANGD